MQTALTARRVSRSVHSQQMLLESMQGTLCVLQAQAFGTWSGMLCIVTSAENVGFNKAARHDYPLRLYCAAVLLLPCLPLSVLCCSMHQKPDDSGVVAAAAALLQKQRP